VFDRAVLNTCVFKGMDLVSIKAARTLVIFRSEATFAVWGTLITDFILFILIETIRRAVRQAFVCRGK